jgi:hypothetical protein
MYLNGGACGAGTLSTTVETGDGADHPFGFSAVGWAPSPTAATLDEAVTSRSATAGGTPSVELPRSDD